MTIQNEPSSHTSNKDEDRSLQRKTTNVTLVMDLLSKCRRLIAELDAFQSLLKNSLRNPQVVEVRQLRSNLVSELRALENVEKQIETSASPSASCDAGTNAPGDTADADGAEDKSELRLLHALRSSNLPFYEAVWAITKSSCTGLVAFWKRFYWDADASDKEGGGAAKKGKADGSPKRSNKDKRKSVMVDVVADDGEEWVKVSTISESRLLFEMAKKGWEKDTDPESGEENENRTVLRNYGSDGEGDEDDDDDQIELIKLAVQMRKAANATRVRYRHPRIRFVIPKIEEGKVAEIDHLLNEIRSHNITVQCRGSMPDGMAAELDRDSYANAASLDELDLSHLLPHPFKRFTPTLNVDCTLLLAMVSDLSHFKNIPPSPSYHKAILRQIEIEKQQPLLPTDLWPAMDGHDLVCTEEAAKRMREIVDIIGTETEKKRTEILMGDSPFREMDGETLIGEFQQLSDYSVPTQWRLPVRTVEAKSVIDSGLNQGQLPPIAHKVVEILSEINRSVFFYGWVTGLMTITSNRTVVKQVETTVENHRHGDDNLEGPLVWVCDTARSLVGKEKGRKS